MIKIFRKIRQRLLTENRFSKYLLYAIGEIVLVAIGILLALQINNANEARKKVEKSTLILEQVQKELAISIQESDRLIEYYQKKDSLIYLVMNNQVTYEDYNNDKTFELYYLIANCEDLLILDNGFSSLMLNIENLPAQFEPLIENLNTVYVNDKNDVYEYNIQIDKTVSEHMRILKNNAKWFANYAFKNTIDDGVITYFLSDPFYKNYVAQYSGIAMQNHLPKILKFRTDAIRSYKAITKALGLKDKVAADTVSFIIKAEDYRHWIGSYNGIYIDDEYNSEISIEENTLIYRIDGWGKSEILPLSNTKFYIDGYPVFFSLQKDEKGVVGSITFRFQNMNFVLKKN